MMFKRRVLLLTLFAMLAVPILSWSSAFAVDRSGQENVSNTGGQSEAPQAAAQGSALKVIWGERDNSAVVVKEKTTGSGFSGATTFAEGTRAQFQWSDVAITPNGATHIVYATGDVIYHRSKTIGGNWSDRHRIASDNFPNPVRMAAAPNGTLWVVWRDGDGTTIRYRFSSDGGNSWNGGDVASEGGNMSMPDVAVGTDNVPHVVWYRRSGDANGNTARYADWNGGGWNVGSIGGGGDYVSDPVIVVDSNNVQHVAYRRQAGSNWRIQHASRAPGQGWGGQEDVRTTPGNAGYAPAIGVDRNGGVHVTWSELNGSGGRDVFYSAKLPGGGFGDATNVSEHGSGWNSRSAIAITDDADGVRVNIFYQRGAQGADVDEIFYRNYFYPQSAPTPTPTPCPTRVPGGGGLVNDPSKPFKVYLPLVSKTGC